MKKSHLLGAVCALSMVSSQAGAVLLDGETINYQYYFPDQGTPLANADNGNHLVGAGVEIANAINNVASIDISDTNLFMDFVLDSSFTAGTFNGFTITDVFANIPSFTSVTIDAATNLVGFDASRITFDADSISVNFASLAFDSNTIVSLNVSAVPIPATIWLFGSGLLGLIGVTRRKKMS